ncbi:MAG: CcmD family protein [Dehalococcoidales bacterium]|nr:MAG: CcmD family protein [Dehalococcoidales bacterium]
MENAGFLFAAFAIVWVLLFGFVFLLFNRQRQLRAEINTLRESLKDSDSE